MLQIGVYQATQLVGAHIMRKILKQLPIEQVYPRQWEMFANNGYTMLNEDALYKWASILDIIDRVYPDAQTILDVGGGYAATTFLLSKEKEVTNIDLNYNGNWFASNKGIISNLKDYNVDNIKFKQMNFLTESDKLEDEYYDVIIDGCSLIHFQAQPEGKIKNIGLAKSAAIIYSKLKRNGVFVVSTDLNNGRYAESAEWLDAQSYISIICQSGFRLMDEKGDLNTINSYNVKNLGNLTIGAFAFVKL